jgi:transcriptional antiterminator NusG
MPEDVHPTNQEPLPGASEPISPGTSASDACGGNGSNTPEPEDAERSEDSSPEVSSPDTPPESGPPETKEPDVRVVAEETPAGASCEEPAQSPTELAAQAEEPEAAEEAEAEPPAAEEEAEAAESDTPEEETEAPPESEELAEGDADEVTGSEPHEEEAEEEAAEEEAAEEEEAVEEEAPPPSNKRWYVVKVQSGREESIKEAIERKVKIEGLEEFYGQIHIPTEKVQEVRHGKRVEREKKLYPGYIMAEVEYNDRILYLFRETSGVGDFVGGTANHPPPPMTEREVERMRGRPYPEGEKRLVAHKPKVDVGDRVRITEGAFKEMEGEVKQIHEAEAKLSIEVSIFGRPVPVELEYWQVDQV